MLTCTVDLAEFHHEATRARNDLVRAASTAVHAAAVAGRDEAKRAGTYKDRSGRLRQSIKARHVAEQARGAVWEVWTPTRYALFVEAGTRPHRIDARNVPNLHFYWTRLGRWFTGPHVNHPGTRAYPFMGPGFLKAESFLEARLSADLARISARWS